jgi:selenocysteine-specific elongation factor
MRRIVMGTAGHIDHGKTSLVKALTGYDADRLKEEKERGITISLGFTSFLTRDGDEIGIVDVPGHEKFIKTMISGASGMDMIILVIAADDGVMPQTREHLDICTLLGIKHGLIALTKIDTVDGEWLELVTGDIKKFVSGTFLHDAPIVKVSTVTGEGIDRLKETIEDTIAKIVEREISGLARMPVDRIFTMKGFGTVLTGSLISGELNTGDDIQLLPSERTAKIRGLQQHGNKTDRALPGSRIAVNLSSLEKDEGLRGELLVMKGTFPASNIFDVHVKNVSAENITIKSLSKVRFLALTNRRIAEIRLLSGKQLKPGESAFAQIVLKEPLPLVVDDRFILLGTSKIQTLGGGIILNPVAKLIPKKRHGELIDELKSIMDSGTDIRAEIFIKKAGLSGMSLNELSCILNKKEKALKKSLTKALSSGLIVQYDADSKSFVSNESLVRAKGKIVDYLADFHKANPARAGMGKEELKSRASSVMPEKLYGFALKSLSKDKTLVISSELVLLKEFEDNVKEFSREIKVKVEGIYKENGLTPPFFPELKKRLAEFKPGHIDDTLSALLREKKLVRISEGYYLHEDSFNRLKEELTRHLKEHSFIDAGGFKSITNASRKYTIPLLEKFDMLGVTIRRADNSRILGANTH